MIIHAAVSEFTSFQNIEVWNFVIMLAILSGALLLAGALRRMIPLLRKSLLPGAVLAGFLLLLGDGVYRAVTGVSFFRCFFRIVCNRFGFFVFGLLFFNFLFT